MPFGNVYLSNPLVGDNIFLKAKIKKRVKNYYVWGASSRNYNKISGNIFTLTLTPIQKKLKTWYVW